MVNSTFKPNQKVLFLCVKPIYMKHILSGKKDIEIRKQMPSLVAGDGIVLYSTSPDKEIVGTAKVKAIHNYKNKANFWREFKHRVGICIEDYFFYTLRAKKVIGIELEKVKVFTDKVDLDWIRMRYKPNFMPPQGYMYLTGDQANLLIRECD